MSSILDKFPGLTYRDIRVTPFSRTFTAPLAGASFTWNNQLQNVHSAQPDAFYFLDTISFSADLDLLVFQNALDLTTAGFTDGFSFSVFKQLENSVANLSLINFGSYVDDLPLALGYKTNRSPQINGQNIIQWRINGRLIQTAELVALGKTAVTIFMRGVIYTISNLEWVAQFFESRNAGFRSMEYGNYYSKGARV